MKNYSVKNKNYCVNNEKYCVNKLIYCVNNFGFDIQPFGCAQLASPQGSLNFVNPYPDLCNLQGNAQETELFYYHPDHLGSTGMVTDNSSIISQGFLYAPFGEIISEYTPGWETDRIPKYAFNAKELDEENGMYYYSARYYAPPTFISRDPMFEKYPSISPYTYCANNPMKYVDPSGEELNPIFDLTGNFLGTDNKGIQGEAIIMDKKDFKQGMSNKEAMQKGTTRSNLPMVINPSILDKIDNQVASFPSRPDWDGQLTLEEANDWYRNGQGNPLFVDASKIDLSPVQKSDFSKVGDSFYKNFAFTTNTETGLVYGNIKLTLMNDKGDIKLGGTGGFLDKYNFDYKKGVTNIPRNIATWIGEQRAGKGTIYNIFTYGIGKVK